MPAVQAACCWVKLLWLAVLPLQRLQAAVAATVAEVPAQLRRVRLRIRPVVLQINPGTKETRGWKTGFPTFGLCKENSVGWN